MIGQKDIDIAKKNWVDWISVFEHTGILVDSPLLFSPEVFKKFLHEYGVGRTIRAGKSNEFREALRDNDLGLAEKLSDYSGKGIDELEDLLRPRFGVMNGDRVIRSVISKIAAFLVPAQFIAWDRFARAGVIRVLGRQSNHKYETYADYLNDVNLLLTDKMNVALISACRGFHPTEYSSKNYRFERRVLDVYLMRIGGRW